MRDRVIDLVGPNRITRLLAPLEAAEGGLVDPFFTWIDQPAREKVIEIVGRVAFPPLTPP
jgi:hypothetical protein